MVLLLVLTEKVVILYLRKVCIDKLYLFKHYKEGWIDFNDGVMVKVSVMDERYVSEAIIDPVKLNVSATIGLITRSFNEVA